MPPRTPYHDDHYYASHNYDYYASHDDDHYASDNCTPHDRRADNHLHYGSAHLRAYDSPCGVPSA